MGLFRAEAHRKFTGFAILQSDCSSSSMEPCSDQLPKTVSGEFTYFGELSFSLIWAAIFNWVVW